VGVANIGDEVLQPLRFLPEVSRRPHQLLELGQGSSADAFRVEHAGAAQLDQGALDIGPGGVLGEKSAHDYFKPALRRPPMLASPGTQQPLIEGAYLGFSILSANLRH
jgi:hypothetical protein